MCTELKATGQCVLESTSCQRQCLYLDLGDKTKSIFRERNSFCLELITYDPLIYIQWTFPSLNVSNKKEKSISAYG